MSAQYVFLCVVSRLDQCLSSTGWLSFDWVLIESLYEARFAFVMLSMHTSVDTASPSHMS